MDEYIEVDNGILLITLTKNLNKIMLLSKIEEIIYYNETDNNLLLTSGCNKLNIEIISENSIIMRLYNKNKENEGFKIKTRDIKTIAQRFLLKKSNKL